MFRRHSFFVPRITLRKFLLAVSVIAIILAGRRWLASDGAAFLWSTGRIMPHSASVISTNVGTDSRYELVFQTSPSVIESWLDKGTIFWGEAHWSEGQIPSEIPSPCPLIEHRSRHVWHAFRWRPDIDVTSCFGYWHNTDSIVVEPETGMVWFIAWTQ